MGASKTKCGGAPGNAGRSRAAGGRVSRQSGGGWQPQLVGKKCAGKKCAGKKRAAKKRSAGSLKADTKAGGEKALAERIERVRRALYDLYGDLEYFKSSRAEHRERLRQGLEWPDVGHITSLLRSLAEEDRFAEWLRFNRHLNNPGFAKMLAREKIA